MDLPREERLRERTKRRPNSNKKHTLKNTTKRPIILSEIAVGSHFSSLC